MMGSMVTAPAWLLLVTHLLCVAVGAVAVYLSVVHLAGRALHCTPRREDHPVPNRKLRRSAWLTIVLLIASGMVVAIGVAAYLQGQQAEDQRDADKRAAAERAQQLREYSACISTWGADLVDTINERGKIRARYDRANQDRSDALGRLVVVIIALRETPPEATEAQFNAALEAVARADERVRNAAVDLADVPTYQPPTLTCGRTP